MQIVKSRIGDLFTHVCLLGALMSIAWRLEATDWVPGLDRIGYLIFFGYILGVLLGISRFKPVFVIFLTAAYTAVGVTWQAVTVIESQTMGIRELLVTANQRFSDALFSFINNLPVEDPILFYIVLGVLLWLTAVGAAYLFIKKKSPWLPLLLSVVYLLIIDYFPPFDEHPGRYLLFFVLITIILIGRIWYLQREEQWISRGYRIDSETGFNILKSIAFSSLVVVLISWNIPAITNMFVPGSETRTNMSELWIETRSRISNMFASLEAPFFSATDFYEDSMRLGSNIPVGNETLFLVHVPNRDKVDLRFYWRGHSFDTYQNGEWFNTFNGREQAFGSLLATDSDPYIGRKPIELEFDLRAGLSKTFYLPMLPASIDKNAFMVGYETFGSDETDMMSIQPVSPMHKGDSYTATVYASQPTVTQLRQSGTGYPEWITDHYLQLPDDFPERIRSLASQIVSDSNAATPYDEVAAINYYLRTEIAYEPLLALPPQTREPIDWMLFDSRIGFCNYYATAEVLMLRSIGVPARFAAGYAQGEPVGDSYYNVRVRDSHAWPEVYFPGVGWVEFEPTAAQPVRDLPLGQAASQERNSTTIENIPGLLTGSEPPKDIDAFLDNEGAGYASRSQFLWVKQWLWLFILLFFVGTIVLVQKTILTPRRLTIPGVAKKGMHKAGLDVPRWLSVWSDYADLKPIQKMEAHLSWLIRRNGIEYGPGATLKEKFKPVQRVIPTLTDDMNQFISLFYADQYGLSTTDFAQVKQTYRRVRKALLQYWLQYRNPF